MVSYVQALAAPMLPRALDLFLGMFKTRFVHRWDVVFLNVEKTFTVSTVVSC